ncbi:uncharacterized protein LOC121734097 isoform X2 [Aricia agestis]|uniref:uncharacterized protein LOC121734097 isoform X2 n=1 Tax=Aricia agestis TaxID=91739 RepID=UPI001C201D77|nr:uncharacterized protein LOC121734097 isoform X2 [Aricia agestis]
MFFANDEDVFINPEVLYALRPNRDTFEVSVPTHTEDGIPIRKLYVSNLPPKTTRTELFGLFAPYGFIKSCWLRMEDKGPNREPVSTYAFVTFSNPADAHKALVAPVHEKTLRGRRLKISPADSWHQPVEDANGKVRWKPRGQNNEDGSTPENANNSDNATSLPETSQQSSQLETEDAQSDSEQGYNILDILNRDCLNHILTYVSIRDIIRSERVSKRWQSMVQEYLDGVRVFKTSWWQQSTLPLTTAVLRRVLSRLGAGLHKLHIDHHWSALNDRTAHTVGKFCPNLDEIKVVGMHTKNWNPLLYGCKQLKNLSFISCNKITDSSLVHLVKNDSCLESLTVANNNNVTGLFLTSSNPSKLTSLAFYNCYNLQGAVLCAAIDTLPNITTLKLDVCPTTMWKIVPLILEKLPNLEELSLSQYVMALCGLPTDENARSNPIGDEAFCKAISNLKKLKVLNLSRNIYITNSVLKQVAQSCQALQSLNVSACNSQQRYGTTGISDEGILAVCGGCSALTSLDVSYLAALTDAGLAALPRLPRLRNLAVCNCPALTAAPLVTAVQRCPLLEEVDASGSGGVSERLIEAAVAALNDRPRLLTLWLAGTAAAIHDDYDDDKEPLPTHRLLTVELYEDRSEPHLGPSLGDSECSDDSYDFDPDLEAYIADPFYSDDDFEDELDILEQFEYHMPNFVFLP